MLKSIKRSDSYLLESSSSNNSTSNIITTSTNNTQNSLLKRTTKPNVSSTRAPSFTFSRLLSEDTFNYNTNSNSNNTNIHNPNNNNSKYSTIHGISSSSRRNNFLKVCSWPFTKIESFHDSITKNDNDNDVDNDNIVEFADDQSTLGNDDGNTKHLTIADYSNIKRKNFGGLISDSNGGGNGIHGYNYTLGGPNNGSSGPLTGINPSLENINHVANEKFHKVFNRVKRPPVEQNNKRRCVLLSNLNESMGLNSVLQQVCGGPLEKLTVLSNGKIELFFIFSNMQNNFIHMVKPRVNSTLSSSLMSDILHNGCRRCLIISKNIPGKRIRNGDKMFYPEPDIHYSTNLNFEEIKNDFNKFGKVLDIGSVISRKLCFSIFYYDIRCAILAKQELDLIGSELNKKYKDWSIWYGKDITDRACFVL
ncbi:hypothetical protein FOB64_005573 [Candida albicans]|uniref:Uncharacterized protein n=1 Tax=Candida albicans TaxID=5476 RepID=A0A8H6BTL2_CANAX|nr:hypothetical protein FOB64_005573 [Candida albicans]